MAIHWVNGGDVQWEEMYTAELPKLVSLPAYPLNGTDIGCLPQKLHRNRKKQAYRRVCHTHRLTYHLMYIKIVEKTKGRALRFYERTGDDPG